MYILIYRQFTATRSGSATRNEICEKCRGEFSYDVEATAQGAGSSPFFLTNARAQRQAAERAEANLKFELERRPVPVACPYCNWYQTAMVKAMLAPRMGFLKFVAWLSLIAGSIVVLLLHGTFSNQGRKPHYEERPYIIGAEIAIILFWFGILYLRLKLVNRENPNNGWAPPEESTTPDN